MTSTRRSSRALQLELDGTQQAATNLRRLQMPNDALARPAGIVNDDLDRVHTLDRTTGGRATEAHELGQLGAQVVVERLVKAHLHRAALVRSQAQPTVTEDRDMHAPAHQTARTIGTTQAAVLLQPVRAQRGGVGQAASAGRDTSW